MLVIKVIKRFSITGVFRWKFSLILSVFLENLKFFNFLFSCIEGIIFLGLVNRFCFVDKIVNSLLQNSNGHLQLLNCFFIFHVETKSNSKLIISYSNIPGIFWKNSLLLFKTNC